MEIYIWCTNRVRIVFVGLTGDGLRQIEIIKKAKRIPTPIATPVRHIKGILEAKYLNPKSTIELKILIERLLALKSKYKSIN